MFIARPDREQRTAMAIQKDFIGTDPLADKSVRILNIISR